KSDIIIQRNLFASVSLYTRSSIENRLHCTSCTIGYCDLKQSTERGVCFPVTESYVDGIWANDPNTASTTAADGALTGAHMAAAAAASANPAPAALQLALDPTMQMFPRLIDRQTMNLFGFPAIMPQVSPWTHASAVLQSGGAGVGHQVFSAANPGNQ
ncbi:hypothetical protein HPB47_025757, partial [Ixodes persulcatus]